MARTTKQLSGGGKDKFLRSMIDAEAGVGAEAAKRLAEALTDAITDVRVKREVWEATSKPGPGEKGLRAARAKARAAAEANATKAQAVTADAAGSSDAPTAAGAFDPFAFSAVALLTKKGKAALSAELATIASASDLKAIATAQHLAIDPAVNDIDALRTALVAATERRIAERRAAAG